MKTKMKTSTELNYQAVNNKLSQFKLIQTWEYQIKSFKVVVGSVLCLCRVGLHLLPPTVDVRVLTNIVPQTLAF